MPNLGRFILRDGGKYVFIYSEQSDMDKLWALNQLKN